MTLSMTQAALWICILLGTLSLAVLIVCTMTFKKVVYLFDSMDQGFEGAIRFNEMSCSVEIYQDGLWHPAELEELEFSEDDGVREFPHGYWKNPVQLYRRVK